MSKQSTLLTYLSRVADPRRKQGQRYPINAMFIIMCALHNKFGYHEIGRFCKNNQDKLLKVFKFKILPQARADITCRKNRKQKEQ